MILYESTSSVFELLWDLALTLFIFHISFLYYISVFVTSCLINYLRFSTLLPLLNSLRIPDHEADLVEITAIVLASTLWARWIIVSFQIPRTVAFRLVIGGAALGMMVGSDLVLAFVAYERSWDAWRFDGPMRVLGTVVALMALFALMPMLLMLFETRESGWEGEKVHSHEGKPIVDAVPTITVTEKKEATEKQEKKL